MQNLTKHRYLLCYVKVSHLRKTHFDTNGPLKVVVNTNTMLDHQKYQKTLIFNKNGGPKGTRWDDFFVEKGSLFGRLWPFMAIWPSGYQKYIKNDTQSLKNEPQCLQNTPAEP